MTDDGNPDWVKVLLGLGAAAGMGGSVYQGVMPPSAQDCAAIISEHTASSADRCAEILGEQRDQVTEALNSQREHFSQQCRDLLDAAMCK